jgi:uncharacterized damage-inducible protein DinB
MESLLEAWRTNNRINLYLLEAIPPEGLATPLAKGKAVGDQFAHIHNVRLMWLKVSAPDLNASLAKIEKGADRQLLEQGLKASGVAIEEVLRRAGSPDGKIKNFKPHAASFLNYLVAHESFHRAHAEIALRQAGTPLSDKIAYGAWEWGVR